MHEKFDSAAEIKDALSQAPFSKSGKVPLIEPIPQNRRLLSDEGYIYVIEAVGLNAVKIGFTASSPHKRLSDLQTGCPVELRLIGAIWRFRDLEKALHQDLRSFHIRGEWFDLDSQLVRAVYERVRDGQ